MSRLLILCAVLLAGCSGPSSTAEPTYDDPRGGQHQIPKRGLAVLFWVGNGCPIVQRSLPELRQLRQDFQDIPFLLVHANPLETPESVAAEAAKFEVGLPVLLDHQQHLTRQFGVQRTATAVVLRDGQPIYQGALDDALDYGARRPARQHFLRQALEQARRSEAVTIAQSEVRGCLIDQK